LNGLYVVELKDEHGTVHAVVERTVYIAEKNHYRQKIRRRREMMISSTSVRVAARDRCLACRAGPARR
jgi:hypothetical protein